MAQLEKAGGPMLNWAPTYCSLEGLCGCRENESLNKLWRWMAVTCSSTSPLNSHPLSYSTFSVKSYRYFTSFKICTSCCRWDQKEQLSASRQTQLEGDWPNNHIAKQNIKNSKKYIYSNNQGWHSKNYMRNIARSLCYLCRVFRNLNSRPPCTIMNGF